MKIGIYIEVIAPFGLILSQKKAQSSAYPSHLIWVVCPTEAIQNIFFLNGYKVFSALKISKLAFVIDCC